MAWLPEQRLADKPTVKTEADINLALAEMAAIKTRGDALQAALDSEIERVKGLHSGHLQLETPSGKTVRFCERFSALSAAVESYATTHKDELLTGKLKSRKFPHGELAWKCQPQKIDFTEKQDEKSVLAKIEKRGVTKALQTALEALSWFGSHLGVFVTFSLKLNKSGLLAAVKAKSVTEKQLAEAGLKIGGGDEKLTIKLTEYKTDQVAA